MLSDRDILKLRDKEIVIYPFVEKDLTPLGYNLNPSDFVVSLNSDELVVQKDGYFEIQPHDTVLILTKEAVWVSKKIAGTFHSKVGVVSDGFGHISTTLDPNWKGPLLISLNNPTDKVLKLSANKSFITLIFYKLRTPAKKDHDNKSSRIDIVKNIIAVMLDKLDNDLTVSNKSFIKRAEEIFVNPDVYQKFTDKVTELTDNSRQSIIKGLKNNQISYAFQVALFLLMVVVDVLLFGLLGLRLIWKIFSLPHNNYMNSFNLSVVISLFAILVPSLQFTFQIKGELK
jgi:deoxycytidine triphosphate deaminase